MSRGGIVCLAAVVLALGFPVRAQTVATATPNKFAVGVADFEVNNGDPALGRTLADDFATPLFSSGRFTVFERSRLRGLLLESQLSQTGLTEEAASRLRLGGVNVLVGGSLTLDATAGLRVNARAWNTVTGEVQYSATLLGRSTADFPRLAGEFVAGMARAFPLQGTITDPGPKANQFYVNLGSNVGLKTNSEGVVYREQLLASGRVTRSQVAVFTVERLDLETSLITARPVAGVSLRPGDLVAVRLEGQPVLPPTGGSPGAVPATLTVTSDQPGSEVFINDTSRGVVPAAGLTLTLPAATYTVVVRTPGFQDVTEALVLEPNASRTIQARFRPLVGGLRVVTSPAGATVVIGSKSYGPTPLTVPDLPPGPLPYTLRLEGYEELSGRAIIPAGGLASVNQPLTRQDPARLLAPGAKLRVLWRGAGNTLGVGVVGDHAYLAGESGLQVIDLSDPASPAEISVGFYDTPGHLQAIVVPEVFGNRYAVVALGGAGLEVIDLARPEAPTRAGGLTLPGDTRSVAVSTLAGAKLAVTAGGSDGGLQVIDLADPTKPRKIGALNVPGNPTRLVLAGNYAYVAAGERGLQVVDLTDPSRPKVVGNVASRFGEDVVVNGQWLYFSDGETLRAFALTDPKAPREVKLPQSIALSSSRLKVVGSRLYASNGATLRVFDLKDPAAPELLGEFDLPGDIGDLQVIGDLAYVAASSAGLRVLDVRAPAGILESGFVKPSGGAGGVAVANGLIYAAQGTGLGIYDPPARMGEPPVRRAFLELGMGDQLKLLGTLAFVTGWDGLRIVDVSDPGAPRELKHIATPRGAYGLTIAGSLAFVALREDGLMILDVSNPGEPREVSRLALPGGAYGVAAVGRVVAVGSADGGLHIVDVSTPTSPKLVTTLKITAVGLTAVGDLVYVAALYEGLQIVSLADPARPRVLGVSENIHDARAVMVLGSLAYVADGETGVRVLDVSNPASPRLVGNLPTPGTANDLAALGSSLIVADSEGGLVIAGP